MNCVSCNKDNWPYVITHRGGAIIVDDVNLTDKFGPDFWQLCIDCYNNIMEEGE